MQTLLRRTLIALVLLMSSALTAQAGHLRILPDHHLTPDWVKAGAYFKDNGRRVKVDHVHIHVMLPKHRAGDGYVYGVRDHREDHVGEPDWSGWWHEPWRNGFFYYTVTADYEGRRYQKTFVVGRNRYFEAAETAAAIAEAIVQAQAGN